MRFFSHSCSVVSDTKPIPFQHTNENALLNKREKEKDTKFGHNGN